jgi:hypothetical protein
MEKQSVGLRKMARSLLFIWLRSGVEKRNVTPRKAVEILKKSGIEINEKDAKIILDFLYILAKLTVNQYFNEKKN